MNRYDEGNSSIWPILNLLMICALVIVIVGLSLQNKDLKGRLVEMDQLVVECVKSKYTANDELNTFTARLPSAMLIRIVLPDTDPVLSHDQRFHLQEDIRRKLAQ